MPRRKFDKKTSTTYALVHRAQTDPLIHDENAPSQVFTEISGPSSRSKVRRRGDLEEEFGLGEIRENEGEAAEHGIYYDDSKYDYMQHMRDLGSGSDATWVEAQSQSQNRADKSRPKLEDALRDVSLDDDALSQGGVSLISGSSAAGPRIFAKGKLRDTSYQSQQDIPDAIAGFQPDMDPRLREVLEALDDEAYVDDDDDDIFAELAGEGGEEVEQDAWEDSQYYDDDDDAGWESDDTTKPTHEYRSASTTLPPPPPTAPIPDADDGAWLATFAKSKSAALASKPTAAAAAAPLTTASTTASTALRRRKKRKGALTSPSNYSMTSSALARTEPLSVLDERFDRLAASYMDDEGELYGSDDDDVDDGVSLASGATGRSVRSNMTGFSRGAGSGPPKPLPAGFDALMDEFLGKAAPSSKQRKAKGGQSGLRELDEIRGGLGPARLAVQRG